MGSYAINETAEFAGEWRQAGAGEGATQIAGELVWSGRATLELHSAFTKLRGVIFGTEDHDYPAVHGTTTRSELVTLLHGHGSGARFSIGAAGLREPERITASWVVVGAHVLPDTKYTELRARIPGLQFWISRSGVMQTIAEKSDSRPFSISYTIPAMPEEFTAVPQSCLSLGWGIDRLFSGDLVSQIKVDTSACLRIKADEPQPLEWFVRELGKVTTLLALLAGSPMSPDRIGAKVADGGLDVDVLVALRESQYCSHKKVADFFLLRDGMDVELGDVFVRWFGIYDTVAMPSQLALSVLSSKDLWPHVEFLSLMQALEGFHRAVMPGSYVSKEAYQPIASALAKAIPITTQPAHKDALKSRIRYGYQYSLRKRLDELASRLVEPMRIAILGGDGTVPSSWVDTRNYYTHWDEALQASTLDGLAMHRACVRLKVWLRVLYLQLVGVPDAAIMKALNSTCNESQYLLQLNAAEHRERHPGSTAGALMHLNVQDAQSPSAASA